MLFSHKSKTCLTCRKNGTTKNVVQTSCIVKKYSRSCSESMTKLRSCNDMRAATQLKNSWTATGATCSLLGMRGNHRSSKVSRSDAQRGNHLEEDGFDKFSSSYFFVFHIKAYEELKGHTVSTKNISINSVESCMDIGISRNVSISI